MDDNSIRDIYIQEYTPKSLVIRGNTKAYKEELKKLGGKYNSRLKDIDSSSGVSPGWIFSKAKANLINNFLTTGQVLEEDEYPEEIQMTEQVTKMREIKATPVQVEKSSIVNHTKNDSCSHCQELRKEIAELNQKMDKILNFFDKSEQLRKNMMTGAGNMMKNIFGATAEMMNDCTNEIYKEMDPFPRPQVGRIMRPPPSVSVIEDDCPTAILFQD